MLAYAILRLEKIKNKKQLVKALKHVYRVNQPQNADPERKNENRLSSSLPTFQDAINKYDKLLPEKVRKNAVHALEFVITASPEILKKSKRTAVNSYLDNSIKWVVDQFGGPNNHIGCAAHWDEKSPHLHFFIMPLKDGKLNCKHFINGPRALSKLQTDFHEKVAKRFNLQRGIKKSKAKHQTIKRFYTQVNEVLEPVHVMDKTKDELYKDYNILHQEYTKLQTFKEERNRVYEKMENLEQETKELRELLLRGSFSQIEQYRDVVQKRIDERNRKRGRGRGR